MLTLSACDLQPKIKSIPDSVGDFISVRYPALLADPEHQPEIYNSAASDYGVYASPQLYGSGSTDDYVLYSSVNDYILGPQVSQPKPVVDSTKITKVESSDVSVDDYLTIPAYTTPVKVDTVVVATPGEVKVAAGDTLYALSKKYSVSVEQLATANKLSAPYSLSVGQTLKIPSGKATTVIEQPPVVVVAPVKAEVIEIKVEPGDTLYSLSRKYSLPVNDLAVMNKLSAPFTLSVGQKLKVPNVPSVVTVEAPVRTASVTQSAVKPVVQPATKPVIKPAETVKTTPVTKPTPTPVVTPPKEKISSAPVAPLPKIDKRTSSKFSWPLRGTILSGFGAKSNGLYNDGINISAKAGTVIGAAENGVVAYAGNELKGMGNLVIVQHEDGWMTVYAHMDKMSVRRGVKVKVGQQIGTVGQTGKVDKPQLHFEIRKGTKSYDPAAYLKK